jgi:hypothetical protein
MSNWNKLAEAASTKERSRVTEELFRDGLQDGLGKVEAAIAELRQILLVKGLAITDVYFAMVKENAFGKDEARIVPRVRMDARYGTPTFYWEKVIRHAFALTSQKPLRKTYGRGRSYEAYVRRKGSKQKEKMRVVLLSEHVPINKATLSVSMSAFSKEPEWAQLSAQLIEPELAELRHQAKLLSNISRAVKQFARCLKSQQAAKDVL